MISERRKWNEKLAVLILIVFSIIITLLVTNNYWNDNAYYLLLFSVIYFIYGMMRIDQESIYQKKGCQFLKSFTNRKVKN